MNFGLAKRGQNPSEAGSFEPTSGGVFCQIFDPRGGYSDNTPPFGHQWHKTICFWGSAQMTESQKTENPKDRKGPNDKEIHYMIQFSFELIFVNILTLVIFNHPSVELNFLFVFTIGDNCLFKRWSSLPKFFKFLS